MSYKSILLILTIFLCWIVIIGFGYSVKMHKKFFREIFTAPGNNFANLWWWSSDHLKKFIVSLHIFINLWKISF